MKNIRTEIHITVATYIGEDVGEGAPPLCRSANDVECVSLSRVQGLLSFTGADKAHLTAKNHVEGLLANAATVLAARVSHNVRNLHIEAQQ